MGMQASNTGIKCSMCCYLLASFCLLPTACNWILHLFQQYNKRRHRHRICCFFWTDWSHVALALSFSFSLCLRFLYSSVKQNLLYCEGWQISQKVFMFVIHDSACEFILRLFSVLYRVHSTFLMSFFVVNSLHFFVSHSNKYKDDRIVREVDSTSYLCSCIRILSQYFRTVNTNKKL